MAPSRLEELEERWKRNKKSGATVFITTINPDTVKELDIANLYRSQRPNGLRVPDFVRELVRLGVQWGDRRFIDCVKALFEHEIVDKKYNFTTKRGPRFHYTESKQQEDVACIAEINSLMKKGHSQREACRQVAADSGRQANSFNAAVEQLRNLSRGKRAG
jgi:hypothetical protein